MGALNFEPSGNLVPGVHWCTWPEFVAAFGTTAHRSRLLEGLHRALHSLREAGCQVAYVDGSFVTQKEEVFGHPPGDFDACWDWAGVDPTKLDPTLLDFSQQRAAQKAKFFGELFPAQSAAEPSGTRFLEFFQQDKHTGQPKGIIALNLASLP